MANQITFIHKAELITSSGRNWDITAGINYLFINESLFNFHLLGCMTMIDSQNWLEKLPIDSNCILNIYLTNNESNNSINLTFRVTGVSGIMRRDDHNKKYNIDFVSPEAVNNFNIRISKGYAGPSYAIVNNVMANITSKPMLISKTKDDAKLLAANMHPYEVIDLLELYGSKTCYDFLFWENFRGLNFQRISELLNRKATHKLIEKDLRGVSEKEIMRNSNYQLDKTNIVKYYKDENESLISYMKSGELGNSTYTYNSLNGMPYKYDVNDNNKENIVYHFNEDTLNYQNYGSRHKILNELINNEMFVVALGDFDRCTGDRVFVEINGRSKDVEYTNELSGNFLITSIEHELTLSGYKQTLGLSR